mmetsp:Transcript_19249/g.40375  ORF Transcript_19249/g.40375 Transcript_19249/m.40375 type:complete len:97 (-) Transcript_19249:374-664(-)
MSGSPRTSNSQTSAFTLPWKDPRCEEQEQQQSRDYHHQQQQQQQQQPQRPPRSRSFSRLFEASLLGYAAGCLACEFAPTISTGGVPALVFLLPSMD